MKLYIAGIVTFLVGASFLLYVSLSEPKQTMSGPVLKVLNMDCVYDGKVVSKPELVGTDLVLLQVAHTGSVNTVVFPALAPRESNLELGHEVQIQLFRLYTADNVQSIWAVVRM